MAEIQTSFETVFTPEHWGETPAPPSFRSNNIFLRVHEIMRARDFPLNWRTDSETKTNVQIALAQTSFAIASGQNPESIHNGELIGGVEDMKYALPGNILLLDSEKLVLNPKTTGEHNKFRDELELAASAVLLHKRGYHRESYSYECEPSDNVIKRMLVWWGLVDGEEVPLDLPVMTHNSYRPSIQKTEIGWYQRSIELAAFYPNKKGKMVAVTPHYLEHNEDGSDPRVRLTAAYTHIGRVGEVLNLSVSDKQLVLTRIKSAYVCARGAFEYARQPVKSSRLLRLGKLATSLSR